MRHTSWHLDVRRQGTDGVDVVSLAGRAGTASIDALREALRAPDARGIVVDLSGLDYIAGAGLNAMREAAVHAAARKCPFILCGLEGAVRNAFELAGMLQGLAVEPDVARALARVSEP